MRKLRKVLFSTPALFLYICVICFAAQQAIVSTDTLNEAWTKETANNLEKVDKTGTSPIVTTDTITAEQFIVPFVDGEAGLIWTDTNTTYTPAAGTYGVVPIAGVMNQILNGVASPIGGGGSEPTIQAADPVSGDATGWYIATGTTKLFYNVTGTANYDFGLYTKNTYTPAGWSMTTATAHIVSYNQYSGASVVVGLFDSSRNLIATSPAITITGNGDGTTPTEYSVSWSGSTLTDGTTYLLAVMGNNTFRMNAASTGTTMAVDPASSGYSTFDDPLPSSPNETKSFGQLGVWLENSTGDVILGEDNGSSIYTQELGTDADGEQVWDTDGLTATDGA